MQYIIDFIDNATEDDINQYLVENALQVVSTYNFFTKVFLVSGSNLPVKNELVESIVENDTGVIVPLSYAIASGEIFPKVDFVTEDSNNWWKVAVQSMPNFNKAVQTVERRGQNAIVYVVDSGIKKDHPEFEFSTVSDLFSFNNDFTDYNGHGTAIASVLCGKTCAISDPLVKSVKIFQAGADTLKSHLISAFDAILEDVTATPTKFHIVNLSWSIPRDLYIENKIRNLIDQGVCVVAAAGNSGTSIENVTPACMPEVYTVGAYGTNLTPCDFSNYTGTITNTNDIVNTGELDVWSPGENILIATLNNTYSMAGGTSMAAAIYSAATAYNCDAFCYENGDAAKSSYKLLNLVSIGKPNLIIKDEKYAQSSNYMTMFLTEYDGDNGSYATISNQLIIIGHNEEINFCFGPRVTLTQVEFLKPLPSGLKIEGLWLRGSIEVLEENLFESLVQYTSPSGRIFTKNFRIVFLPMSTKSPDFNPAEVVSVTTLNFCGAITDSFCDGSCIGGLGGKFCTDACANKPGFTYCYCYPPAQVCP